MLPDLLHQLRPALTLFALFTLLTGIVYPLAVTGIAAVAFPHQATGSLITNQDGQAIGSRLIGQPFDDPQYFWGRPSATTPHRYNAAASTGSNLGALNEALEKAVKDRVTTLQTADPANNEVPPIDLVTTSASGLDPHISPAAAYYQVNRVARARNMPSDTVRELVNRRVESRTFGLLGEPRVNVLLLNIDLDQQSR
jgi:K+-transporting ATPase ATPase C chain